MLGMTKEEILQENRDKGYFIRRNVDMTRDEFINFCNFIGEPWPAELHKLHTETYDDDGIVDWSSKTRFKEHSLPWHADNPWHPTYKFPIRAFYAVKIPDENDGAISFLNITDWFEELPEERKEYFRSLEVLTQDYKKGCQPYWSSFVKKHPITNKESFYWGSMYVISDVFGLQPDEGYKFPHFAFTMAIQKPSREIVSHEEISSWFASMMNEKYLYTHYWKNGDLVLMDNWVNLHYRGTLKCQEERLLWRKSILQPWQKYIG